LACKLSGFRGYHGSKYDPRREREVRSMDFMRGEEGMKWPPVREGEKDEYTCTRCNQREERREEIFLFKCLLWF
jgi:hypothetical protein